jgi:hypothetical protein
MEICTARKRSHAICDEHPSQAIGQVLRPYHIQLPYIVSRETVPKSEGVAVSFMSIPGLILEYTLANEDLLVG